MRPALPVDRLYPAFGYIKLSGRGGDGIFRGNCRIVFGCTFRNSVGYILNDIRNNPIIFVVINKENNCFNFLEPVIL